MNGKKPKETVQGYEIKKSVVFQNNRGFAFAENPRAPSPYVTWQFTEDENGLRDYYWGHYASNIDLAEKDYELRVSEYAKDYGIRKKPIAQQIQEGEKQAALARAGQAPDRAVPETDKEER